MFVFAIHHHVKKHISYLLITYIKTKAYLTFKNSNSFSWTLACSKTFKMKNLACILLLIYFNTLVSGDVVTQNTVSGAKFNQFKAYFENEIRRIEQRHEEKIHQIENVHKADIDELRQDIKEKKQNKRNKGSERKIRRFSERNYYS